MTIIATLERRVPDLILVQMRKIGIERRKAVWEAQKVKEEVDDDEINDKGAVSIRRYRLNPYADRRKSHAAIFQSVVTRYERIIHDPATPVRVASFYAIKFARFQV